MLFVVLDCETRTIDFESVEVSERAERDRFRVEVGARDLLKLFDSDLANLFDHFIRRDSTSVNDLLTRKRARACARRLEAQQD